MGFSVHLRILEKFDLFYSLNPNLGAYGIHASPSLITDLKKLAIELFMYTNKTRDGDLPVTHRNGVRFDLMDD